MEGSVPSLTRGISTNHEGGAHGLVEMFYIGEVADRQLSLTRRLVCSAAIPPEAPEAARWLGADTSLPEGPATLAELFALRDGEGLNRLPAQPERIGVYL